jgi:AraC-like DNA-binding protein
VVQGVVIWVAAVFVITNLLVDIAYATGFSSQANFNRAFRRAVGTTPSAYRAQKLRD